MQLKEIIVENYMQALLKAALLLGDPERTEAIRRIAVCAYRPDDSARRPLPRCLIFHELTLPLSDVARLRSGGRERRIPHPLPRSRKTRLGNALYSQNAKAPGASPDAFRFFGAARGGRPIPR